MILFRPATRVFSFVACPWHWLCQHIKNTLIRSFENEINIKKISEEIVTLRPVTAPKGSCYGPQTQWSLRPLLHCPWAAMVSTLGCRPCDMTGSWVSFHTWTRLRKKKKVALGSRVDLVYTGYQVKCPGTSDLSHLHWVPGKMSCDPGSIQPTLGTR